MVFNIAGAAPLLWIYPPVEKEPDPYENALAERMNSFSTEAFPQFELAYQAVKRSIDNYNHLRPHASLDFHTLAQDHQLNQPLKKRWKKYKKKAVIDQLNAMIA